MNQMEQWHSPVTAGRAMREQSSFWRERGPFVNSTCQCPRCLLLRSAARGQKLPGTEGSESKPEKLKKISTTPLLLSTIAAAGLHDTARALCFVVALAWPLVLLPRVAIQTQPALPERLEGPGVITKEFIESAAKASPPEILPSPAPPERPRSVPPIALRMMGF
jgi:hypothetical protein